MFYSFQQLSYRVFLSEYRLTLHAFYNNLLTIKGEKDNFHWFCFKVISLLRFIQIIFI